MQPRSWQLYMSWRWPTANGKGSYGKNNGKITFSGKGNEQGLQARFVEKSQEGVRPTTVTFLTNSLPKDWVVYCKRPFANPKLCRGILRAAYTHKIAIRITHNLP